MREDCAKCLRSWRNAQFRERALPSYLDATCLLSDQAIVNIVAQAVRLLAQYEYGGTPHLHLPFVRSLLHAEHALLDDAGIQKLSNHLEVWLKEAQPKYGHLVRDHNLTSKVECPKPQQQSTSGVEIVLRQRIVCPPIGPEHGYWPCWYLLAAD
ncbi:hypothetical protein CF326_g5195 [Tilletia indica]|nr:hypothetical protein CF326_g5195 [Tilletia indica]